MNPEKVKADSPPRAPAGLRPRSERQAKIRRELMEDDDDHGGVYRKSRAAQGGSESDSSSDAELNLEEAARAKEVRLQGELGFTDPMLVLSQFRATKVAKFCFKSQAELRDHLVFRHKLKTLPKAVTMRDFFQSYKVSSTSYLCSMCRRSDSGRYFRRFVRRMHWYKDIFTEHSKKDWLHRRALQGTGVEQPTANQWMGTLINFTCFGGPSSMNCPILLTVEVVQMTRMTIAIMTTRCRQKDSPANTSTSLRLCARSYLRGVLLA